MSLRFRSPRRSVSRPAWTGSGGLTLRFVRALAVCLAAGLTMLVAGCEFDDPSGPEAAELAQASSAAQLTLTITGLAGELKLGQSGTMTVTVQSSTALAAAPSTVAIQTDIGTFGQSDGPTSTTIAVSAADSSGTKWTGSAKFFAGETTGTATITASLANSTVTYKVSIISPPPLFIQSATPISGPATGGTVVRLVGQGYNDLVRVDFGGLPAPVLSVADDGSSMRVRSPALRTSIPTGQTVVVDIKVTLGATSSQSSQTDTLTGGFTYTPNGGSGNPPEGPPSIISISPNRGPNSGGTTVSITGAGFAPNNVEVYFGAGTSAANFTGNQATLVQESSSVITVTTPAAGAAYRDSKVSVLVRNAPPANGLAQVLSDAFEYFGESLIDLTPSSGDYSGQDVCGNDISAEILIDDVSTGRLRVEFGGVEQATCDPTGSSGSINCSVSGSSPTTLDIPGIQPVTVSGCSPPSGALLITDLQTGDQVSGETFSYTADVPVLSSISPQSVVVGDTPTATDVTLSGTFSYRESTTVTFGGTQATLQTPTSLPQIPSGCPSSPASLTTLVVEVPAFTGSFTSTTCTTSSGASGTRLESQTVDVVVRYPGSGCSDTLSGAFTYTPSDTSCTANPTVPVANFSYAAASCQVVSPQDPDCSDLTLDFTDHSTGSPTTWLWDFGHNTSGGTLQCTTDSSASCKNPRHTFPAAGTYTVTLTVANSAGSATFSQTLTVPLP